jgi:hypothetical protein
MKKYKIDVVAMLNRLHVQYGEDLSPLLVGMQAVMNRTNNLFCDGLANQVEMIYQPTTEGLTLLPAPVWAAFNEHPLDWFVTWERPEGEGGDEDDNVELLMDFSTDLAELLLIVDGQVDINDYIDEHSDFA